MPILIAAGVIERKKPIELSITMDISRIIDDQQMDAYDKMMLVGKMFQIEAQKAVMNKCAEIWRSKV